MNVRAAYLVTTDWRAFRPGEPAKIVGVDLVTPPNGEPERACYHVEYADGHQDWTPIGQPEFKVVPKP